MTEKVESSGMPADKEPTMGETNPCGRCCWPEDCADGCIKPPSTPEPQTDKVYEVVKFVNPRDAVAALEGIAVHGVAGPNDADCHGILRSHPERDGCMVSFHDVLTDEETARTDVRNFVEVIVP